MRLGALGLLAAFVSGCGRGPTGLRAEAPLASVGENVRSDDAVLARFQARTSEQWSLRRADGTFVCMLPCSYWVKPRSGLELRLESPSKTALDDTTSWAVSDHLAAQPGEEVVVTVDRTHGFGTTSKFVAAPLGAVFGLMGVGFAGISIASLADGGENTTTTVSGSVATKDRDGNVTAKADATSTATGTSAAITGLAIGVGSLAVASLCWYWFFHARDGSMEVTPSTPKADAGRVRVRLTPMGMTGTF
jgi:hypothetical protein